MLARSHLILKSVIRFPWDLSQGINDCSKKKPRGKLWAMNSTFVWVEETLEAVKSLIRSYAIKLLYIRVITR